MKTILACLIAAMLLLQPATAEDFGKFIGALKYKPIGGGIHEVLEDFEYRDPNGRAWPVPAGTKTDGASIPSFAWPIIGSPFTGDFIYAAVVHDFACDTKTRKWQDVHRAFYAAMRAGGEQEGRAKLMFLAVWFRGPRWSPEVSTEASKICQLVHGIDGKAAKVCSYRLVKVRKPIPFPEPTNPRDLARAPTAVEIESLVTSKRAEAVDQLSLADLEAKANQAWKELQSVK
jgi:hypothetical protein